MFTEFTNFKLSLQIYGIAAKICVENLKSIGHMSRTDRHDKYIRPDSGKNYHP